jgi:hypothetical protein
MYIHTYIYVHTYRKGTTYIGFLSKSEIPCDKRSECKLSASKKQNADITYFTTINYITRLDLIYIT